MRRLRAFAGAVALLLVSGAAAAQQARPALVWSLNIEPDEGFKFGFYTGLALHADGTALLAIDQERGEGDATVRRLLLQSISPDGRVLARSAPQADSRHYSRGAVLAADADGFALFTNRGPPEELVVYRLARDGRVRATQPVRVRGEKMQELGGLAADGRGNVIVFGGGFEGPHSPALALLDRNGRVAWSFVSRHPMPPGGVYEVRFRRGGGSDAVVLDREKPFWERRSSGGALVKRAALPFSGGCWRFLGERRLAHFFYNWEEQPHIAAPAKRWVLALHGENGRLLPGHVVLDLPAEKHRCRLAVHESGWIAAAVEVPRIALFDFSLARRAEIDTSAHGARESDVFAVDAAGGVTALAETDPVGKPGRKLVLLRFAPPAR